MKCFICGEEGHSSKECPNPKKERGARTIKCFNCGEEGHSSRDCQKPKVFKCYNCGKEGHSSRNCPEQKKERFSHQKRWNNTISDWISSDNKEQSGWGNNTDTQNQTGWGSTGTINNKDSGWGNAENNQNQAMDWGSSKESNPKEELSTWGLPVNNKQEDKKEENQISSWNDNTSPTTTGW